MAVRGAARTRTHPPSDRSDRFLEDLFLDSSNGVMALGTQQCLRYSLWAPTAWTMGLRDDTAHKAPLALRRQLPALAMCLGGMLGGVKAGVEVC
jgi:hypothetical protein